MSFTYRDIAGMLDHSLLSPTSTVEELENGLALARRLSVASVCILPSYLARCAEVLEGSGVLPSTTIGFPHGGHATAVKAGEAISALDDGGVELDMVVNVGRVRSGHWDYVYDDIRAVIEPAHARGAKVKVIFENCYLNDEQKIRLCEICGELDADWVKTSTGFGTGGATEPDLRLMRRHAPAHVQVKASGGIRTLDELLAARALGATRIGSSRSDELLAEAERRLALGDQADPAR